jgi:general L-amino acid transport system permease protein
VTWARKHLFNGLHNTIFTIVFGAGLVWAAFRIVRYVFVTGRWEIIRRNVTILLVRLFPRDELWRVWLALFLLTLATSLLAGALRRRALLHVDRVSERSVLRRSWPVIVLVVTIVALRPTVVGAVLVVGLVACAVGGWNAGRTFAISMRATALTCIVLVVSSFVVLVGFGGVDPDQWGGLMLTFVLAVAGIVLSFPFGVLLALGRRSRLPVVRAVCVAYIELIRGVPLITLLFMGFFVLGFILPAGSQPPRLIVRALVAIVLFTAAYIAEIVRGGLQAVGRGQADAAMAVGLSPVAATRLIVLPQALRAVIPGLVGQFITLFKDTSLVAIVGLRELLGTARALTSQGEFVAQGLHAETLVFASFVYWTISYTMSKESQRLERRLGVGTR